MRPKGQVEFFRSTNLQNTNLASVPPKPHSHDQFECRPLGGRVIGVPLYISMWWMKFSSKIIFRKISIPFQISDKHKTSLTLPTTIAQFGVLQIDMDKIIIALTAIRYFIFLFIVKDISARLLVRTRGCTYLSITVVKLTSTCCVWFHVHSWDITLLNCFYFLLNL